jgi:transcriptional regulator with XRE-family HTH domain
VVIGGSVVGTDGSRHDEGRHRFGRLLFNALKARSMKQEDLAGLLGTTQSSVSGWINGKYEPSAETVFTIERCLEMDPGYLSRPLGYLPVEAVAACPGVEAAVSQSTLLDEEDKAVIVSLYELLVSKRADEVRADEGGRKTAARRRRPPAPTPVTKRSTGAAQRAQTAAQGR